MDWRVAALLTVFFWGAQAVVLKAVLGKVSWTEVLYVLWVAAVVSGAVLLLIFGAPHVDLRYVPWILLFGVLGALGYVSFTYALERGPAVTVVPLTSLNVAFAVFLSVVLLNEEITLTRTVGLLLAIAAAVLLSL